MRPGLVRHAIGRVVDPAAVFAALYGAAENAFWLDGGAHGTHYLGTGTPVPLRRGAVLAGIRHALDDAPPAADDDGSPEFRLGLVGWLEYELRGETLGLDVPGSRVPARFLRVDRAIAVDAETGEAEALARGRDWRGELGAWRHEIEAVIASPPARSPVPPGPGRIPEWRDSDAEYRAHIAACQAAIAAGDAYQLCLTTSVGVPGARPDPVELHERLRASSPTHHGGLIRIGDTTLVSASPERFLRLDRGRRLSTSPIKGTRRRADDPVEDARLAGELIASEKERAENLMIVDLMRNDLARVCELGTVEVTRLLEVESYARVHQLVSTVEGRLRDDLTIVDAIAACFPAGSMTGAPKRRATELLAELEGAARGVYSGAFGWIGFDGTADLAMVIRSIVLDADGAGIGTGGGITALSVPEDELAEIRLKAVPLLEALGPA